jgi:hypothetical protein
MPSRLTFASLSLGFLLLGAALLYAAADSGLSTLTYQPSTSSHAPMEVFGIGPEMFQDRMIAWTKAFSEWLKTLIGELGVILLAVYALKKTLSTQGEMKERLDRQGERIDAVALAVPAATVGAPVKIEKANVEIEPPAAAAAANAEILKT